MFLPLDRKPDWHNPPIITLLLIVVNVLCFAVWQHNDEQYQIRADHFYRSSSLPDIELPLYKKFLNSQNDHDKLSELEFYNHQDQLFLMLFDGKFQPALQRGEIVKPDHPEYSLWQQQRQQYLQLIERVTIYTYSLKTAEPTAVTLFTHMFLHGSWGHLIGNMLFLFLVGFSVELTLGRSLYLFSYLTAGICSGLFYILLDPHSMAWGIGASGAVSGLIGMYTVLFGMRKIRFFYTLLFYFDYVRAPAIMLLPAYLLYELYNQFFSPSNINNLAHIGGLLSGALIAFLAKRFMQINFDYLDQEEKEQKFKSRYQEGMNYMASMDIPRARQVFVELEEDYPDKLEVIEQLFNIAKFKPGSEELHTYANKLLNMQASEKVTTRYLHDIFVSYVESVQPNVRLYPEQLITLALRFASGGFIEDAEKIVLFLTTRKSDYPRNPEGLMALATHYKRNQNPSKAGKYLDILLKCYPDSNEAHTARQMLA